MRKKQDNKERSSNGNEKIIRINDDLLWGVHPVFEALSQEPERIGEIFLSKERKGGKIEEIIEISKSRNIKIHFVSYIKLVGEGASQVRHQGVVAKCSATALVPFETFLDRFAAEVQAGNKPHLLVCDSLQDPHNLGAVIRSAYAAGMFGVIITRERSAPLGGVAAKASAGAISHIDLCQVTNLVTALQQLKKVGAWVYGAVKDDDALSIYESDFTSPSCIVVGSEGKGIRPLVKKECDHLVSIPMKGKLDSLNISVAAAVIVFEVLRQNNIHSN